MQMGQLNLANELLVDACQKLSKLNRQFEAKARCDLGFLYYLLGDSQQAQVELDLTLHLTEEHGDLRHEALASTRLAYILEADNQVNDAFLRYERGCDLHNQMGQVYYAMNAVAGLARIAFLRGNNDTALDHVVAIWKTIGNKEMDATIETARTLRTCYTILDAHNDPCADAVLAMAWAQLQHRVSTIVDPAHMEHFWQIEDHRFFQQLIEPDLNMP